MPTSIFHYRPPVQRDYVIPMLTEAEAKWWASFRTTALTRTKCDAPFRTSHPASPTPSPFSSSSSPPSPSSPPTRKNEAWVAKLNLRPMSTNWADDSEEEAFLAHDAGAGTVVATGTGAEVDRATRSADGRAVMRRRRGPTMSSYGTPRHGDDDRDEATEALLATEKPSTPRPPSPSRRRRRGAEYLICGHRPLAILVVLVPASLLLISLVHFFPSLIHHSAPRTDYIIPPRPTHGLKKGDAAYNAATGPWADVGDDWDLSSPAPSPSLDAATLLSNGTHPYQRTVLVVSLDGVRADYLTRGLTPHLLDISQRDGGIRADYMQSIFPTLTFPNHWSILTGLYAESHGIIGNDFYDPPTQKDFFYVDPARSWQTHWWKGEPIWATAEKAGVPSAVLMWPGPPVLEGGVHPSRWYAFEDHVDWSRKTALVEEWLDLPLETRPRFIAAYLPEVDQEAHRSGTDSEETNNRLRYADDFAKSIHDVLAQRNLLDIVDVFYVSDHGMTETSDERLIYLEEILGEEGFAAIEHRDGWPSCGLRFKTGTDVTSLVARLEAAVSRSNNAFTVYTADTMPTEWHFSSTVNDRIAPVYIVPSNGWSITNHEEMRMMNGSYGPRGNHGYEPTHPDMHAIFVAHGPWARAAQARHTTLPGFKNVELHSLFARLLDIAPAMNNGTKGFWDAYF